MQKIEIHTVQEAARVLPKMGVLTIALLVQNGDTVEVYDEKKDVTYVFNPKKAGVKDESSCN